MRQKQKKTVLRQLIDSQIWLSRKFDRLLPEVYRIDGNKDFLKNIAPHYIEQDGLRVYDLGGGSQPLVTREQKEKHNLTVYGIDIDEGELMAAPRGIYDEIIVDDLSCYEGRGDADLIISQATLEHVHDNQGSFRAFASTLKPGGKAILFTPSRNAAFARLNMLLPETLKRKILFKLFPHKAEGHDGFPAYYDYCTPKKFKKLAIENSLEVVDLKPYYISSYFQVCFPVYFVWRLWMILFKTIGGENAAETFTMILRRKNFEQDESS